MAQGDINLTIVGNITNDPELRFTPSGAAVASFTVASNSRYLDKTTNEWKDGEPVFMRCSVWRQYAENVAESLTRGTRVIVTGRLKQRSYDNRDGQKVTVMEMEVDDVGPALRTATAKVTKVARQGGGFGDGGAGGSGFGGGSGGGGNDDPWANQSGGGSAPARGQSSGGGGDSWGGGGQSFDEPPF